MAGILRFRRRRAGVPWDAGLAIAAVLALGYVIFLMPVGGFAALFAHVQNSTLGSAAFSQCSGGGQPSCVVDGDTFRYEGTTIRIADIDTPEVRDYKCASELELGLRATDRLVALMNAGPFEMTAIDRDEDVYGRKLRIIWRDGQSLGLMLVAEGLAREWDGARHPWCA